MGRAVAGAASAAGIGSGADETAQEQMVLLQTGAQSDKRSPVLLLTLFVTPHTRHISISISESQAQLQHRLHTTPSPRSHQRLLMLFWLKSEQVSTVRTLILV